MYYFTSIVPRCENIATWLGGLVLFLVAALYIVTLDNGLRPDELTGGDLITHQYAQVQGRPSNAPGYPLYTMGGWLWFRVGGWLLGWLFNPLQILSLYSTLWGLASLGLLYLILLRIAHPHWWLAPLLTLFYATTFFFWYYSVTTEQYTSAVFQTLLLIWLAFKWEADPQDRTLLWLAFISGTMLANMVTTLFILPPLLWLIFTRRVDGDGPMMLWHYFHRPRLILQAIGVTLLPFLSYAYIYIRGAQHPEWRGEGEWATAWEWFIQFLTIQQGRDELGPGLSLQNFFTAEFPSLMWHELTWPIFFGGLIGLVFLGRRRAIFLYSTLVIYFFFSWAYRFGNWFQVILPAYPLFVIGVAAGIKRLGDWEIGDWKFGGRLISIGMATLLIVLIGYRFALSFPEANQRDLVGDTGLDPGWAIVADEPQQQAVVVVDFAEEVALQYLGLVWGATLPFAPLPASQFSPNLTSQDTTVIYTSRRASPAIWDQLDLSQLSPQASGEQVIALNVPPQTIPDEVHPLALDFGDKLQLIGWTEPDPTLDIPPSVRQRGVPTTWQLVLYWQTNQSFVADYTISVRPLVAGQLIAVAGENLIQDHQPVWGVYPTSQWQPSEVVRDVYTLPVPPDVIPDSVHVVVYRATADSFENLADHIFGLDPQ